LNGDEVIRRDTVQTTPFPVGLILPPQHANGNLDCENYEHDQDDQHCGHGLLLGGHLKPNRLLSISLLDGVTVATIWLRRQPRDAAAPGCHR
jgi:hypothetical protein